MCGVCICVLVQMCTEMHVCARIWHQCLPRSLSSFLLAPDFLLNLLVQSGWPAIEFHGSSYLSSALELQACVARPGF